jgi:hypothetical protein
MRAMGHHRQFTGISATPHQESAGTAGTAGPGLWSDAAASARSRAPVDPFLGPPGRHPNPPQTA